MSVIDKAVADRLGLASPGVAEWSGVTETGERSMASLRTTRFELVGVRQIFELDLLEAGGVHGAVPGLDLLLLLGWDFLGRCKLVCDGPTGAFELFLPPPPRVQRRRR